MIDESKKKLGEEELMKVNGGSSDADSEEKSAYDPENTYPCNQVIPPWIIPTPAKPTDDD